MASNVELHQSWPLAQHHGISKANIVKLKPDAVTTFDRRSRGSESRTLTVNDHRPRTVTLSMSSSFEVNEEEDIMTRQRIESFGAAFPSKKDRSKSIIAHLDSLPVPESAYTTTGSTPYRTPKSPNRGMTNKMMYRPSALPEAARSGKLQWRNISIFVGDKSEGKQILHDFTGEISSGQLLAVMGGSGAGMLRERK